MQSRDDRSIRKPRIHKDAREIYIFADTHIRKCDMCHLHDITHRAFLKRCGVVELPARTRSTWPGTEGRKRDTGESLVLGGRWTVSASAADE